MVRVSTSTVVEVVGGLVSSVATALEVTGGVDSVGCEGSAAVLMEEVSDVVTASPSAPAQ